MWVHATVNGQLVPTEEYIVDHMESFAIEEEVGEEMQQASGEYITKNIDTYIKAVDNHVSDQIDDMKIKDFQEELDKTYQEYQDITNMSASELKARKKDECSTKASLDR